MNETCFLCEIFSCFGDCICSVSGYSVVCPVGLRVFWDCEVKYIRPHGERKFGVAAACHF